jgi:hypothetical protein
MWNHCSSTLKIEAGVGSSETLVPVYQTTQLYAYSTLKMEAAGSSDTLINIKPDYTVSHCRRL